MSNVAMKFLYFTDPQCTAKTPSSRTDMINVAIMRKFFEIGLIAKANNVDAVICGGDFFDIPRVSLKFAGTLTEIMKTWGVPVYVTPGNHDMYGYTISNIDQTMLGFLAKTGVVTLLLKGESITFPQTGFDVVLEGQEYHKDIDKNVLDDYRMSVSTNQNSTVNILVPHGMLVEKPFVDDTYTLISDVAFRTDANVILGSHYHPGWPTQVLNNVLFYNPGSLVRISDGVDAQTRHVKVGILNIFDTGQVSVDDVYLKTMKPYAEVFSPSKSTASTVNDSAMMTHFKQSLSTGLTGIHQSANIMDMLTQMLSTGSGVDPLVIKATEDVLVKIMNANLDNDLKSQGYIETSGRKVIKSVEIKNYMSHEHSIFDFVDGLNIVIGESNAGKTVLFRAINWCLNDIPKGTSFIRSGADHAFVKITYTDGTSVQRHRTDTSPGEIEIVDDKGKKHVFKGFSNKIPVDVMNIHQMPTVNITDTLKQNLSYSDQLSGPFLLTSSSFEKAAAIGKLTGVDVADYGIKDLNKDILALGKTVKASQTKIEGLYKDKAKYDHLPQQKMRIDLYEQALDLYEQTYNSQQELLALEKELSDVTTQKEQARLVLEQYKDLDQAASLASQAMKLCTDIRMFDELSTEYLRVSKKRSDAEIFLTAFPKDELLSSLQASMKMVLDNMKMVSGLRNEMNTLHASKKQAKQDLISQDFIEYIENAYVQMVTIISQTKEAAGLANELRILGNSKDDVVRINDYLDQEIVKEQQALDETLQEKMNYIKSIGHCPLCGTHIHTEEQIQYLSKGGI